MLKDVLRDVPPMTPREVLAWVRNLPLDSATVASIRGGSQFRGWDNQMYMLTNIVDAVRENTYATVSAHSKRRPKPPKPLDRPRAAKGKAKSPMANRFMMHARMARINAEKKAKRKAHEE